MTHTEHKKRRREMIKRLRAGQAPQAIAKRYGISSSYVREIGLMVGINLLTPRQIMLLRRRKQMIVKLKEGVDIPTIAKLYDISVDLLRKIAYAEDVSVPHMSTTHISTLSVVADLLNTNDTLAATANRYGITRQRVHQILQAAQAAGIHVRDGKADYGRR